MDIKNYKINFHNCKNNHINNNILLQNYESTQKVDLSENATFVKIKIKAALIIINFLYVSIVIKIYVLYADQYMIIIIV